MLQCPKVVDVRDEIDDYLQKELAKLMSHGSLQSSSCLEEIARAWETVRVGFTLQKITRGS